MATQIICPECGGIIGATVADDAEGFPCTCTMQGATAVSDGSRVAVGKICVNCGTDVTNAKRLKDKEGNYWCAPCGIEDSRRRKEAAIKAGGGAVVCPDCCGRFPRDSMHRAGSDMICDGCRIKRLTKGRGRKRKMSFGSGAADARKFQMGVLLAIVAILLALAIWWNM